MGWFYVFLFISIQVEVMIIGMEISVMNLCGYHTKMALLNLTTIEDMVDNGRPYHLGILANVKWFFGGKFQFLWPFLVNFKSGEEQKVDGMVHYKKQDDFSKIKEKLVYKKKQKIEISNFKTEELNYKPTLTELLEIEKRLFKFKNEKNLVYLYDGKQLKDSEL